MTDQIEITEELTESTNTFLYGLRRVLMAGIGAVALTQEQIEDFLNKLVERGEIADGDARKLLIDVLDRRKNIVHGSTKKAEEEYEKRMEGLLSRMNIPTKGEIKTLGEKIAELGEKVDELNRQRRA
ncbi:MAG: phasin family protein [Candidatus Promineofilum sp.]|nr:phasin family protein [Promineifilum sp.]